MGWGRGRLRGALVAIAVTVVGTLVTACVPGPPPDEHWLDIVNAYRAASHVPLVTENPSWSHAGQKHAEYIARTGLITHFEDPASPHFTPEGDTAARQSNLAAALDANSSDRYFIDLWMTAPFHAVGILDPRLTTAGYGAYRNGATKFPAAAALNVLAGLTGPPNQEVVTFPGPGATVHLRSFGKEVPNPLTACPGYKAPTGLPLLVMLASASERVSAAHLEFGGVPLELCAFDGSTYWNPDPGFADMGRTILASRNAAVLIPRGPLQPGAYTAQVVTTQRTFAWSFTVT